MMRAIGFLSGICLTIAALLLVLDSRESRPRQAVPPTSTTEQLSQVVADIAKSVDLVPEANLSAPDVTPQPEPAAAGNDETLRAVDTNPLDLVQQLEAQAAAEAVAPQPRTTAIGNEPPHAVDTAAPAPGQQQPDDPAAAQADASGGRDSPESGTYLFWSPFRSVWAAQGFARGLTAATQVPVKVVDGGPGNYRVAFSYQDELQRRERMDRITTVTGLTLE